MDQPDFTQFVRETKGNLLFRHHSRQLHGRHSQFIRKMATNGPFQSIHDYAQALHGARNLRSETHQLKDHAEKTFPKNHKSKIGHFGETKAVTHSVLERQRARGFKQMISNVDKGRGTKYALRESANGLANDYRRISEMVRTAEPSSRRSVALKAARYVDHEVDRQHSLVNLASASWLGKRAKPNGDKSLYRALEEADDSKKRTRGVIEGALYETAGQESSVEEE